MRMPSLPPLQSFNKRLSSTVIRSVMYKTLQTDTLQAIDFTINDLISSFPQLLSCYKEIKVGKALVWVMPTSGNSSAGLYTLCVGPSEELNSKETFAGLSETPGCITRKIYQTSHAVYYPTSPTERNWFSIQTATDRQIFTAQLMCTGLGPSNGAQQPSMSYQIVCDAHLSFRGRATTITADVALDTFHVIEGVDSMST